MNHEEWDIRTMPDHSGRIALRYAVWPKGRDFKRLLVFLNGRTEWIEKYHSLPKDMNLPDDVAFLTWDHRGQGASGGRRSWVESYTAYAQDTRLIIQKVAGDKPYSILAHSMGCLIALTAMIRGYINPKAAVLCSPLLQLPEKPLPSWFAKPTSAIITLLGLGHLRTGAGKHDKAPFETNKLTHDRHNFERIQATPYPCRSATFKWVHATHVACKHVRHPSVLSRLLTPIHILFSAEERVVHPKGASVWVKIARKFSGNDIKYTEIAGARHELFTESDPMRSQAISLSKEFLGLNS
jgi:lysophospholipase